MYLHKTNYDKLTTEQMEEMLMTAVGGENLSYDAGQGNESPSYANLPYFANDAAAIKAGYVLGMPYNGPNGFTNVGFNKAPHGNYLYDDSGNIIRDDNGNPITV